MTTSRQQLRKKHAMTRKRAVSPPARLASRNGINYLMTSVLINSHREAARGPAELFIERDHKCGPVHVHCSSNRSDCLANYY